MTLPLRPPAASLVAPQQKILCACLAKKTKKTAELAPLVSSIRLAQSVNRCPTDSAIYLQTPARRFAASYCDCLCTLNSVLQGEGARDVIVLLTAHDRITRYTTEPVVMALCEIARDLNNALHLAFRGPVDDCLWYVITEFGIYHVPTYTGTRSCNPLLSSIPVRYPIVQF